MNMHVKSDAPTLQMRLHQVLRKLRSWGWPTLTGMALAAAGIVLVLTSHHLRSEHRILQQRNIAVERMAPKLPLSNVRPIPAILPGAVNYTADLARIFDIAKDHGIALGSGDYRDADRVAIPVDIRLVDLRFEESYPKLKEFLAALLNTMPHVAVEDLRVERKDNLATRHRVTLKLALVYRTNAPSAQAPATETKIVNHRPMSSGGGVPL